MKSYFFRRSAIVGAFSLLIELFRLFQVLSKTNMKTTRLFYFALSAMLLSAGAHADKFKDSADEFRAAFATNKFFGDCYGYAVFPNVGKGGVGIGGAYGKGQVYRNGKVTGRVKLTQLSIGIQLGGQAYSEIVFFEDKRAFEEFTSGSYEFGAGVSAVAITLSAQAEASTNGATASAGTSVDETGQAETKYHRGFAVFTASKGGLMYEASLKGQKFSYNAD